MSFIEFLLESTVSLNDFTNHLKEKYNIQLWLIDRSSNIELSKIIVPKDNRNNGTGTKVMNEIIDWADKNKRTISLTPTSDFGGSKTKLVGFYKRFGFVENKGSNKNYEISESMYRIPK